MGGDAVEACSISSTGTDQEQHRASSAHLVVEACSRYTQGVNLCGIHQTLPFVLLWVVICGSQKPCSQPWSSSMRLFRRGLSAGKCSCLILPIRNFIDLFKGPTEHLKGFLTVSGIIAADRLARLPES